MTKPLKLKLKDAKRIAIELWAWCEETGKKKEDWPDWEKYGRMFSCCPLCEYAIQFFDGEGGYCMHCPYCKVYERCTNFGTSYENWRLSKADREDRKYYAGKFLAQLKTL